MAKSKYDPYKEMIIAGKISAQEIAKIIGNGCTAKRVRAAKQRFLDSDKYKTNKDTWRKNNPDKVRKARKKYRNPSRKTAINSRVPYTKAQKIAVLTGEKTASELAKEFGRSIDGIYRLRVRLRKEMKRKRRK